MKDVSDVLQFVVLKSVQWVCSFISVRECVFDLYCMSAVVVETIISNFVVCEILPKDSYIPSPEVFVFCFIFLVFNFVFFLFVVSNFLFFV